MSTLLLPVHEQISMALMSYHETGKWSKDYAKIGLTPGDGGGLSVGWGQAALQTDDRVLGGMLEQYMDDATALHSSALRPYMPGLLSLDQATQADSGLHELLRTMAADPLWRSIQDRKFASYLDRARNRWKARGWSSHMSLCLLLDMEIQHGSDWLVDRALRAIDGKGHQSYRDLLIMGTKDHYGGVWDGYGVEPYDPDVEADVVWATLLCRLDFLMTEARNSDEQVTWRGSTYRCNHLMWLYENHTEDFAWGMQVQTTHPDNKLWTISPELLIG